MHENKSLENAFATVGAVLWTVQAFPQLYKSFRSKSTRGVSPELMIIWALSSLFFCVYTIVRQLAIPAIVQIHFSLTVFTVLWVQCLYYGSGYSIKRSIFYGALWASGCIAFEVGSIFGLLAAQRHNITIPAQVYGYMSSITCVIGLLPQYYEIYKQKEVTGLSYPFVCTNAAGAVFYMISLFFRSSLDISAMVIYVLSAGMMLLIVVLALLLNPKAAKKRELEKTAVTATITTPPASTQPMKINLEDSLELPKRHYVTDYSSDSECESGPSTPTGLLPHHDVPILEYTPSGLEAHHETPFLSKYNPKADEKV
ncbi:uncharacterized protein I303_103701 [Kwoniella dejecticola CBS 10117]|uniref:Uncharacterized protein n=1 Tax=Kwoniella dejecticola CBS 10117 TaxID=1296121 RepID=A0A1A6A7G8_9TREE|nr:uncharacterized protein I303_03717 [Kwoniella dejecticola CBS 10117]OBR86001.1 hypothetical protein I303_03717 [Kwoniella dejecticola CBS 10117]